MSWSSDTLLGSVLADSASLLSLCSRDSDLCPANDPGTAFPCFVFVSWTSAHFHFHFRWKRLACLGNGFKYYLIFKGFIFLTVSSSVYSCFTWLSFLFSEYKVYVTAFVPFAGTGRSSLLNRIVTVIPGLGKFCRARFWDDNSTTSTCVHYLWRKTRSLCVVPVRSTE